jgi:uncharacterized protein YjbI with pentapeptide repeats
VRQKKLRRKPYRRRRWRSYLGFRGMTLRDWLPIVIAAFIPVVIALGTWGITREQGKLEDQRAKAERELAEQRAQDEALQAYLDQMNGLLLERDLRESEEDSEVRTLARARTLTVLGRVDSRRKTQVMQFLTEAQLVQSQDETDPVIPLTSAALRGAYLGATNLSGANLSNANLGYADLSVANLDHANLSGANLKSANLKGANLGYADLSPSTTVATKAGSQYILLKVGATNLREANLSHAYLSNANLSGAYLEGTNLSGANLRGTTLGGATLSSATLSNANLVDADLSGADLNGAAGITNEQLHQQAAALERATMPNGQKYEDWRKDKEGRGRDGEYG